MFSRMLVVAGVIDQVGQGVDKSRLGQRVWLYNGQWDRALGTAAEYIAGTGRWVGLIRCSPVSAREAQ